MLNQIIKAISIKLVLVSLLGIVGLSGCASNETKDESLTAEERKEAKAKRRKAMMRNGGSTPQSGHGGCG